MKADKIITLLLGLFLTLGLNVYTSNSGGQGFVQTLNSLSSVELIATLTIIGFVLSSRKLFYYERSITFLILLVVFIFVSALFNNNRMWDLTLTFACVGLLILAVFIVINLEEHSRQKVVYLIVLSALLQAFVGLVQMWLPDFSATVLKYNFDYGRPYGIFSQVNVYASYITTGLACTWMLLTARSPIKNKHITSFLLLLVIVFSFAISQTQSRTAILSSVLLSFFIAFFIFKINYFDRKRKCIYLLTIFFSLCTIGLSDSLINRFYDESSFSEAQQVDVNLVSESVDKLKTENGFLGRSTDAREFIYKNTLLMILEKPLLGYGYGSFEAAHLSFMAKSYHDGLSSKAGWYGLKHPHNILLYTWAEGGILPVLGILLLVGYGLYCIYRVGDQGLVYLALLIPITMHLMTELPFTASVPHIFLYGLLIGLIVSNFREPLNTLSNRKCAKAILVLATMSITMLVPYALLYSKSYINLLNYEKRLPEAVKENATFLLDINEVEGPIGYKFELLRREVQFNKALSSKNPLLFSDYLKWAQNNVKESPSPFIYRTVIMSNMLLRDRERANVYYNALAYYFPEGGGWEQFEKYFGKPVPTALPDNF